MGWAEYVHGITSLLSEAEREAIFGPFYVGMSQMSRVMALVNAARDAEEGTLMPVGGAAGVHAAVIFPVAIAALLVWVALGSGYKAARQIVQNEYAMSGFSQGFVCGLLRWSYSATVYKFKMPTIMIDVWDEENNNIRVDAYMDGLRKGFLAGIVAERPLAKDLLQKLRLLAKVSLPSSGEWQGNYLVQRNYVVELAGAARRHGLIKPQ